MCLIRDLGGSQNSQDASTRDKHTKEEISLLPLVVVVVLEVIVMVIVEGDEELLLLVVWKRWISGDV